MIVVLFRGLHINLFVNIRIKTQDDGNTEKILEIKSHLNQSKKSHY